MRQLGDAAEGLLDLRNKLALRKFLQDQGIGEVVDILARAGEVDDFQRELRIKRGQAFLEKIFDRLDVVIGLRLQFLYAARIIDREDFIDRAKLVLCRRGQRRDRIERWIR